MGDLLPDQESSGPAARTASLVVVAAYLLAAGIFSGWTDGLMFIIVMLLPLACIWFPDALGTYTGFVGLSGFIGQESSGRGVFIVGWVVLFLFIAIWAILVLLR